MENALQLPETLVKALEENLPRQIVDKLYISNERGKVLRAEHFISSENFASLITETRNIMRKETNPLKDYGPFVIANMLAISLSVSFQSWFPVAIASGVSAIVGPMYYILLRENVELKTIRATLLLDALKANVDRLFALGETNDMGEALAKAQQELQKNAGVLKRADEIEDEASKLKDYLKKHHPNAFKAYKKHNGRIDTELKLVRNANGNEFLQSNVVQ